MTSKAAIKNLFSGKKLTRVPFMPYSCTFAAGLRQIPVKDMLTDATLLANSLQDAIELFGYDCITNTFDPTLEAEACGCEINWGEDHQMPEIVSHPFADGMSPEDIDIEDLGNLGRFPVVLEATKRMVKLKGRDVGLVGTVTGPTIIASHLYGDRFIQDLNNGEPRAEEALEFAGRVAMKTAKLYCELNVSMVLIATEIPPDLDPAKETLVRAPLLSIAKVVRFYGASSMLLLRHCTKEQLENMCKTSMGMDSISVGGLDMLALKDIVTHAGLCFGASIPTDVLRGSQEDLQSYMTEMLQKVGDSRFFVSGEWEIPHGTPAENIHAIKACMDDYHAKRVEEAK